MEIPYSHLESLFRDVLREELEKLLIKHGLLNKPEKPKEIIYVPVSIVCAELKVSRTTFHNWRKGKNTNSLIERHIKVTGKRITYDLEGLKQTLRETGILFCNGRNYQFRDQVLTDEQKKMRIIAAINDKKERKNLTKLEREFLQKNIDEEQEKLDDENDDLWLQRH